jgi:hypothetical protein
MAVSLTVTPAADVSQPNVLNVTGLDPSTTVVRFRRAHGTTVEDIPGSWVATANAVSYSDYLYPLDIPVTYMVYDSEYTEPPLATSTPTAPVPSMGRPWVRDLVFPALRYAAVTIVETGDRLRAGRVSPYYVMAQSYAVTVGDVRSASAGTLQLFCTSHADRDTVLYAMSTGNPCALRVPSTCRAVVDEMYFAPVDITETRFGPDGKCLLSVDYVEVNLSDVATFQPVNYGTQTQNATASDMRYSGLSAAFYGRTYADMYLSPTGVAP